jgi:hypothetical protein
MYLEALRLGNKVIEVILTNNEFGTQQDEFKGNKLKKRIKEKELDNVNLISESFR